MPPRSRVPIPLATRGSATLMKRLRILATPMRYGGIRDAKITANPPSVTPTAPGRGKVETATYRAAWQRVMFAHERPEIPRLLHTQKVMEK